MLDQPEVYPMPMFPTLSVADVEASAETTSVDEMAANLAASGTSRDAPHSS